LLELEDDESLESILNKSLILLVNILADNEPHLSRLIFKSTPLLDILSKACNTPLKWLTNEIPWLARILSGD
jgi:hypothetical protein